MREEDREGGRETSESLYIQSVEPEVSQEEANRMALQKTIMSINNRISAMEGGKATFKTETLKRILHIRSICGGNSPNRGASDR